MILDQIDLEHDVATTQVSGIAIDEAHSVALILLSLLGRDGCFPDPVFAVHSWAKR